MIIDSLPKIKSEKSVGRLHVVWRPLEDCYGRCWSQGGPDLVVWVPRMLNPIQIVLNEIKYQGTTL